MQHQGNLIIMDNCNKKKDFKIYLNYLKIKIFKKGFNHSIKKNFPQKLIIKLKNFTISIQDKKLKI